SIEHSAAVYECVDEFRASRGFVRSSVIERMEEELLRKVQLTIVTHENLLPRRRELCSNSFCVPNGADVEAFGAPSGEPAELSAIPRPRLGFVGHIHYWIDLELLRYAALSKPQWSFVLIGPTNPLAKTGLVKSLPN